jgi:hypothetical protein
VQTQSYTTIDKTDWPEGEWKNEPDKMQWQDKETGLPCLIVRGPSGALCGYVGVPEGHPYFKREYDDVGADVHGGLTYSDHCQETESECEGVCHKPDPGESDHVWWLGFDCAHYRDFMPKPTFRGYFGEGIYRNLDFVKGEVANLARQLQAAA